MDNTIILIHHTVMRQSEVFGILRQRADLLGRNGVFDGFILIVCRCVVVGHTENLVRTKTLQPTSSHTVKRLRRSHLMTIEAVYIKLGGTIVYDLYDVLVPYFVEKCVHSSFCLNLLIQSIYASTLAVTISVLAPKP